MTHRLFLIVPPGLEDLALREINEKCPMENVELLKGGLELNADLDWIVKAHTLLKIPTRILMRVTEFKVRDFPKLHQKMANFKWNSVLSHPEPQFEVSAAKSRLLHTGRIEETIRSALSEAMQKQPLSRDWEKKNWPPQTFYVRLFDDHFTLSLDLTGEPLYKRGLQVIKGEAPIRENFAAAMLSELFSGISTPVTLVDPMCGSATLLTEALTYHRPLHRRPFAFETAPFFKGKLVRLPDESTPLPIKECLGMDLNQELVEKVRAAYPIKIQVGDSLKTKFEVEGEMLMLCNPPYGERIKIDGKKGSFLKSAWKKFLQEDRPLRFGWVLPRDMDDLFQNPEGHKLLSKRSFRNGGLPVTFWIWERLEQQA